MKPGSKLAIILFALVAIAHLLRLLGDISMTVGDYIVPQWVSVLGFIVPGSIAWLLWKEGKDR